MKQTSRPIALDGHGRPKVMTESHDDDTDELQDSLGELQSIGSGAARRRSQRSPSPSSKTRIVARASSRSHGDRNRGGAFTFKSNAGANEEELRIRKIAELVGAAESGMHDVICGDFFRRRRRFRRTMQSRVTRELRLCHRKPDGMDL
eukprot:SAG22_NODE_17_length_32684_cov_34.234095_26_plen_148_part_00